MKNSLETRLGIFVALAVIAAVLILETVGGMERLQPGYRLSALFNNIQDLKVGDRVKMAGFEVGRVEKIDLAKNDNKVDVTLKMRKGIQVHSDSVATIKFTGLMGQNYVSVDFGTRTATVLKEKDLITTADTVDFSAVVQKIDNVASGVENLTKTFTGDKLDNLMGPLTDFIKANKGPLTATIANLQSVSSEIAQGKGTVGKMIYDDTLYNSALATITSASTAITNLQDTVAEIKETVAAAHKTVDQVNSGEGTVGKLLHDETLYQETTASMTNLKEILQKVNQGQGSVGKIINDEELYKNAKLTLQKLDQATEGLEDQGPLSILGIAVGKLF
jgi:phospholipid/cholesterol/gamma-HCH transport system substrate-binding protein